MVDGKKLVKLYRKHGSPRIIQKGATYITNGFILTPIDGIELQRFAVHWNDIKNNAPLDLTKLGDGLDLMYSGGNWMETTVGIGSLLTDIYKAKSPIFLTDVFIKTERDLLRVYRIETQDREYPNKVEIGFYNTVYDFILYPDDVNNVRYKTTGKEQPIYAYHEENELICILMPMQDSDGDIQHHLDGVTIQPEEV